MRRNMRGLVTEGQEKQGTLSEDETRRHGHGDKDEPMTPPPFCNKNKILYMIGAGGVMRGRECHLNKVRSSWFAL